MAKKNTTTKKPLKTIIVNAPKVAPFNLTLEDPKENARIQLALQSLKSNAGWLFITQVLKENMQILAQQIIKKQDLNGKPLTEELADEARFKHGIYEELLDKPEYYLKLFQKEAPEENLDPYDQGKPRETDL